MTRQLRRSRDRAARKRRQVTKLVREGTGHISAQEKREMRLAGRPERLTRQVLERDFKAEIVTAQSPSLAEVAATV
jgi:hypothetical protein